MGNSTLTHAVKDLALPEHVVRAVVADYFDFLCERQPAKFTALEARLEAEEGLRDRFYFEAQGSMLGATLILTMEPAVDLGALLAEVYGRQADMDLLDMRKELVSRAVSHAKDASALTGLTAAVISARKEQFCAPAAKAA